MRNLTVVQVRSMLRGLQLNRVETSNIDCKEDLSLKSDGDRALFIRHIAALANTGQKSYLLLGVENKEWTLKGISTDSPLCDVDATQQQMNQILSNRVDPPIAVSYYTRPIGKVIVGVVELEGSNPPYIISIDQSRYGGIKTKGDENYIHRGTIYIRRGADSVIAARQSEVLEVLNGRGDFLEIIIALVFIGVFVGVGVGFGVSMIGFGDPYAPAILGFIWGGLVGWTLNGRATSGFGKFPASLFGKALKNIVGFAWGGSLGALMGYIIIDSILNGKAKPVSPIVMGLFVGPMIGFVYALLFSLTIVLLVRPEKTLNEISNWIREMILRR